MQDAGLIGRARERDPVALTQIYEENYDRIFRYVVLKVGNQMEAEDITQQVFLNAVKSISSYRPSVHPFTAWLYRIAHNQVVDHYRKRGRETTVPIPESLEDTGDDPADIAERNVRMEDVAQAAAQLTKAQREVIALRFTGDLPVAEVARIMGKSQGAVKTLQHSAVRALRKALIVG